MTLETGKARVCAAGESRRRATRPGALPAQLLAVAAIGLAPFAAHAAPVNVSFTGTFDGNDAIEVFSFSVSEPDGAEVTLRTLGYAGGSSAAGQQIEAGGFDPYIALFDADGIFLDDQDEGLEPPADPVTAAALDVEYTNVFDPGEYIVALTQSPNFAIGDLNLTDPGTSFTGSDTEDFTDAFGFERTGAWALDFLNVDAAGGLAPIPLPPALLLLASGLGVLCLGGRRVHSRKTTT